MVSSYPFPKPTNPGGQCARPGELHRRFQSASPRTTINHLPSTIYHLPLRDRRNWRAAVHFLVVRVYDGILSDHRPGSLMVRTPAELLLTGDTHSSL